jgi:cytochrome P450
MDWETFCSSAGVGLSDFRKETPWRPPSIILEADPPLHTKTRAVLTRILSAAAMKKLWTTFDITRRATGHLAFGMGIHGCVGMAVARLEAEIVLSLLARKVETIELDGPFERRLNNTLRGLASLPIRVRPV